jgi:hypothetical protein
MAGAAIVRASAYREAGGYEPRFFMGSEEETLAFKLARLDWQLRYVPMVVAHHEPSVENAAPARVQPAQHVVELLAASPPAQYPALHLLRARRHA